MPFLFVVLIAWYLVYRAAGDLVTGAARVTATAADRLAGTAARLGERGDGLHRQATATAKKLRDRPAPTTPRTRAGQSLGEDLTGALGTGIGALIGWLRLVWVDAVAAAESAQARRGTNPHTMWWAWPTGDEPQAPIHADAERLDRTDQPTVTDPPAVRTGADLGWMGYASEAGKALISENACAWGGGDGQPFCGAPREGDSPFCWVHTDTYVDEFGQQPDPVRSEQAADPATPGCPWIPPSTGRACGQPLHPGSPYCVGHYVVGRYTECLWGDGNPNVPACPHQRAQHQPFCQAHLAEYARRTATAVDTDPSTPIQASAERLDTTPALPAASSDRLAITDGRNEMETAAESGLGAYLSYSSSMSTSCHQGVSSVESTIAALEGQDWSGAPVDALRTAMEALGTAAGGFETAHSAFQAALAVRDAYNANDHAGTKDSVLSD